MIRQRIKAGLKRAVAQGVKLSRPKIDSATERKVRQQLAKGVGILKVAKSLGIGTGTAHRKRKEDDRGVGLTLPPRPSRACGGIRRERAPAGRPPEGDFRKVKITQSPIPECLLFWFWADGWGNLVT
jgi:hypothetical protein